MARSATPQISPRVATPVGKTDISMLDSTDITDAARGDLRNSAEADEEKILKELVIRGPKPDKYYRDRKKLAQWLL